MKMEQFKEKIKSFCQRVGKRNFIILVSEGLGHEFAPTLTEDIEKMTGVETKFARLAHVVRGGEPTLRDRLLASRMGEYAVEQLLQGKSDMVICEQSGQIVTVEISYALILDRMYKGKLKEGDLDAFTPAQVEEMRAFCAAKRARLERLYETAKRLSM